MCAILSSAGNWSHHARVCSRHERESEGVTVVGIQTPRELGASVIARGRGLAGYLLLPRPKDLVKGWLIVVTYALGLLSAGHVNATSVLRALLVAAAVELLVYQARYQWNDVRGFAADQNHPSSGGRGRLPGPLTRARAHVEASCAVAGMRLAITGVLILALPALHLGGVLGFAVAGVFAVAIAYEVLRSLSTGRSGVTSGPIRPGVVLLWLTVGAGYAVRGLVGLGLAIDLWKRPTLLAAAAVTLWCYGIAFVTSRWAVEVTAFAAVRDGRVTWRAHAEQAREHQLVLSRWIPCRTTGGIIEIADWAPLRERTGLSAPWNLAVVVAAGSAAVTGRLLAGSCSVQDILIVAAVGAAATLAVVSVSRGRAVVLLIAGLLVSSMFMVLDTPRPLLAVLPWLLLMFAYLFSTTRTLRKLARTNRFAASVPAVAVAVARLVVGRSTWEAMQRSHERKQVPAWANRPQLWS
jgi:hypothetical protein